jgi:hypothetical protein
VICPFCATRIHPVDTGGLPGYGRSPRRMHYQDKSGENHEVSAVGCPECQGVFLTHSDLSYTEGPEPGTATQHESNEDVLLPESPRSRRFRPRSPSRTARSTPRPR